ncbi:sensor histidine kinase [Candidatus Hodarchaeum mangrovi]
MKEVIPSFLDETPDILSFEDLRKLTKLVFIPSGYIIQLKDIHGNILWEDEHTLKLKGDRVGQKCYKVNFGRDSPCPHCTAIDSLQNMVPQTKEDRSLIDGKWYRIIAIPIVFQREITSLELMRDITEEKHRDQQVESIISTRTLITNIIRHDVPNYLNTINFALEGLKSELKDSSNSRFLEIAQSNTERTISLLNRLRELSLLEDPLEDLYLVNIDDIVRKSASEVQKSFPEKSIEINIEKLSEKTWILGNELISEIYLNIIQNAIKYTPSEKVTIDILISHITTQQEYVNVKITDYGRGIPPNLKEVIFDRRNRINKGWKPTKNATGLGMTIIKSLIDTFGGHIEILNRIPEDWTQGTVIVTRFPQSQVQ